MPSFALPDTLALRPLITRARERLREDFGRKAAGAAVALALEALLLLMLVTMGQLTLPHKEAPIATITFDTREEKPPPPKPAPRKAAPAALRPVMQGAVQPAPAPAPVTSPPPPATIIPLSPQQMQSFDLAKMPKRLATPAGPTIGPAFTPVFGDSKRVGTAPDGSAMYAASWYREPTDQELRGYLSTADGPGWGLITCKTVADYRVEDCVGLDEYPEGSHMLRAVLAAAWQFRVRPPRVNGVSQVGDWVRIRIEYDQKPASRYGDPASR
ncbi:MAG: hypothetical protein J2O44_04435 [Porphyrobacter sp.]|nr:hypothetical protein [Porphyrobacter sp.]